MSGDWHTFTAIIGITVGLGGIVSTFLFYGMVHGQRESVEFLTSANEGLRGALADQAQACKDEIDKARVERDVQIGHLQANLREESVRCAAETAELRGQIKTLQDGAVAAVAATAAETVARNLASDLLNELDRRQSSVGQALIQGQQALLAALKPGSTQ